MSVRNVISLFLWQCDNDLFEEWKRFVDKLGLYKSLSFAASLLGSFASCKIDKVNFTHDNFLRTFHFASNLEMDGKNTMTPGTGFVKSVLCYGSIIFSFKQHLQSFFFVIGLLLTEAFDNYVTFSVFLNVHLAFIILVEQIRNSLIVKLKIRDWNLDLVLISRVDLLIKLWQDSWNDSSILVVVLSACHCEGFSCACLSIT